MDNSTAFFAGIVGGLIIGGIVGITSTFSVMRSEATSRGYGQYCADTGNWAWKGECQ